MSAGPSDGFDSAAPRLIGVAVGKSGRPPRLDGCITSTQPISVIRGRFDHGAACVHSLRHRYVRNHSTNNRAPSSIGVFGRNPTARSRSELSAQVLTTSPGCIGKNSRMAGRSTACSINRTSSSTSTGWLLPTLQRRHGARLVAGSGALPDQEGFRSGGHLD